VHNTIYLLCVQIGGFASGEQWTPAYPRRFLSAERATRASSRVCRRAQLHDRLVALLRSTCIQHKCRDVLDIIRGLVAGISAARTIVSGSRCDASSRRKHGPLVVAFAADRVPSGHSLTETPAETEYGNHGQAFVSGQSPPGACLSCGTRKWAYVCVWAFSCDVMSGSVFSHLIATTCT
jgi:hypothetical protein